MMSGNENTWNANNSNQRNDWICETLSSIKRKRPTQGQAFLFCSKGRHVAQRKNPTEFVTLENLGDRGTSSELLVSNTDHTLIRAIEPTDMEFSMIIERSRVCKFSELSSKHIALVTKISLA